VDLKFASVSFAYPGAVQALRDITLEIARGERIALVGENGAGKSTLAKHLNGLLKPDEGHVLVDGQDTRHETVARLARHVGYVFQNPDEQLFSNTVRAETAFGPKNLGFAEDEIEVRVEKALHAVGLLDQAGNHPYDLLPAQRKLLGIASVYAMDTPILVLDEPTMGLDLNGVEKVSSVLDECFAAGKTVIIISHDLDFCAERVNRYIIMAGGTIRFDGGIESAFNDAELLKHAGLEAPQLVRLAHALGIRSSPGNVDAFLDKYAEEREVD
jgi:energy-coupling factor transport system ATP-binding protein